MHEVIFINQILQKILIELKILEKLIWIFENTKNQVNKAGRKVLAQQIFSCLKAIEIQINFEDLIKGIEIKKDLYSLGKIETMRRIIKSHSLFQIIRSEEPVIRIPEVKRLVRAIKNAFYGY